MMYRYITSYKLQSIIGIALLVFTAIILGVVLTEAPTKEFILIMLGILGVGISIFKPKIPLYLFFLFIPLDSVTVTSHETFGRYIAVYFGFLVFMQVMVKKQIVLPRGSKKLWILAFGVAAILSLLVAVDPVESQRRTIRVWKFVVMYFFMIFFIRNIRTLNIGILCLVIGGFLSVTFSLIMGIEGAKQFYSSGVGLRSGGLLGNPNDFAAMLLALIPLSLLQFFQYKSVLMRLFALGVFAFILMGFFSTFSRGGFIALSVLLMISVFKFDVLKKRSNKIKVLAYTILVAIVGAAAFFPISEKYVERVEKLGAVASPDSPEADASIRGRYQNLLKALDVFMEHPLLGVGIRGFQSLNLVKKEKGRKNIFKHRLVHNTYLEVLTGMGVVGFIPFIAILLLSWRELKRIQNSQRLIDKDSSLMVNYAVAMELSFVGYLVAATFLSLDLDEMTWLFITLSSVMRSISLSEEWQRDVYPPTYAKISKS